MNQNRVVCVVLRGGVGNQLFQYAAGLAAAKQMNAQLVFRRVEAGSVRLDEVLQVDLEEASPQCLRRIGVITHGPGLARGRDRIQRRIVLTRHKATHVVQRWEDALTPRPADLEALETPDLYLDGFFQHPSWFEPSMMEVAAQLAARLRHHVTPALGDGATVVSFRRGDYVRLGWDLPLDYYERALEPIPSSDAPLWVVGDDKLVGELFAAWLKRRGRSASPLPQLGVGRFLRDLTLLSTAEHVVMSNSTYCWWGVSAGDSDWNGNRRTIVAPTPWLPLKNSNALVRPAWTTAASTSEWLGVAEGV